MASQDSEVVFVDDFPAVAAPAARRDHAEGAPSAPPERGSSGLVDLTGEGDDEQPAQRRRRQGGFEGAEEGARGGEEVIDLTEEDLSEETDVFTRAWADDDCVIVGESHAARPPERPPPKLDVTGLDVLREHRKGVRAFLASRASKLKVLELQENKHSLPGTPLFTRFVQAWANSDTKVDMVFHGTPEANVESICREGLDPKRRAGQAMGPGEYFGEDAMVSLGYCQGGGKMIVFCVLTDRSGVTVRGGGVTVIHRVEHQLPIFVITFKRERRKRGNGGSPVPLPIRPPAPDPVLTAEHAKVVRAITKALKEMPPSALPDFLKQVYGLPGVAPTLQVMAATNAAVAALLPSLAHLAGPAMVAPQPAARKRRARAAAAAAADADDDD